MCHLVSTFFSKIGAGLCYGIGFGISAGLIMQLVVMSELWSDWDGRTAEVLKITEHHKIAR